MKNIHLLPTDEPSRLSYDFEIKQYYLQDKPLFCKYQHLVENRNIYITSNNEIKDGDDVKDKWVISEYGFIVKADRIENNYLIHSNGGSNYLRYYKFVIITTDQELIEDGVQSIGDEFLEWFVNNPSCEEVEVKNSEKYTFQHRTDDFKEIVYIDNSIEIDRVKKTSTKNWNSIENQFIYKIIIPKEKIELINGFLPTEVFNKQETLEEAFDKIDDKFIRYSTEESEFWTHYKIGVMDGLQYKQERSYSEEEVKEIIKLSCEEGMLIQRTINDKVKIPYMRIKDFIIKMFEQY